MNELTDLMDFKRDQQAAMSHVIGMMLMLLLVLLCLMEQGLIAIPIKELPFHNHNLSSLIELAD